LWFDDWQGVWRVLTLGTASYIVLIAVLRFSGKRSVAKMSAFDLVVTVALGSILATILLSDSVALVRGVMAFFLLLSLQYVVAALSVRFNWIERLSKSNARCLVVDGQIDRAALRRERVTQEEVMCAVRGAGLGDLRDVAAVVLETDGGFSVVTYDCAGTRTTFPDEAR
jgi:uncharacterized membrane protein YcaP (DUF421 family)